MKKIFASKVTHWFHWYLAKDRVGHYAINSLLYSMLSKKYGKMYEKLISQLQMYAKVIRILSKGC